MGHTVYDRTRLRYGTHNRYPHPKDCGAYFICGVNEAERDNIATISRCHNNLAFKPMKLINYNNEFIFAPNYGLCADPKEVPGCEDYNPKNPLTVSPDDDALLREVEDEPFGPVDWSTESESYPAYEEYTDL